MIYYEGKKKTLMNRILFSVDADDLESINFVEICYANLENSTEISLETDEVVAVNQDSSETTAEAREVILINEIPKTTTSRGRKKPRNEKDWARNKMKRKRAKCLQYTNTSGKKVSGKKFKENFDCGCKAQ